MTSKTFVDYTTPVVDAAWLNDVDRVVYDNDGANHVNYNPPGTGSSVRSVQSRLIETVSLKDFGATGDGTADDTAELQAFFTYLADNGGVGFIPPGSYKITASIALTSPTNGFTVYGSGPESLIVQRTTSSQSAFALIGLHDTTLADFKIDCGHSVTGFASHGISIRNADNVYIRNIHVYEHRNTAVLAFVDTALTYKNVNIIDCISESNGYGQNGFLLEGMLNSSIQNCVVYDLDLTGTPCNGLQLKNKCRGSSIIGGYAKGCLAGIALGSDTSALGEGPKDCIVEGVVVEDCLDGAIIGKTEDCTLRYHADMSGSPAPSGINGFAFNVTGYCEHVYAEVTISGVQAGRTGIRVGSDDISIVVPNAQDYGDYLVTLTAGVDRCFLLANKLYPDPANIYDIVSDSSGTSTNYVGYVKDLPTSGLQGNNAIFFRVPGKASNWISYNGTTDTFAFRANGTDIIGISGTTLFPSSDATLTLGTTARRWTKMYGQTLALQDGITAPATVSGHAQIYVDTADGDLKVKFGDGTVKTIATDT